MIEQAEVALSRWAQIMSSVVWFESVLGELSDEFEVAQIVRARW